MEGAFAPADVRTARDELDQEGPHGLRFDFNAGCRVEVPPGHWRVRLSDLDTGNTIYDTPLQGGRVASRKQHYVRFGIEAWLDDAPVFTHAFDATGRDVQIELPVDSLGDTIAWVPMAIRFAEAHGCRLTIGMSPRLIPLFAGAYPDIVFMDHAGPSAGPSYATYKPILYFNDVEHLHQPYDYQLVGLAANAAHILGVDPRENRPRLALPDAPPPLAEPYVCIAVQSTAQCKHWNNPHGWREVIRFLKGAGYRVVCVDASPVTGAGLVWNEIPNGVEDQTGHRPLLERAHWLRHATAFVGLSSGLSWLAWAAGAPVVLISGFTHPMNEFATPYRVINLHACNACFNDVRLAYDKTDRLWCPRHAGTPRQFECTRLITAQQVIEAIRRIPAIGASVPPSGPGRPL